MGTRVSGGEVEGVQGHGGALVGARGQIGEVVGSWRHGGVLRSEGIDDGADGTPGESVVLDSPWGLVCARGHGGVWPVVQGHIGALLRAREQRAGRWHRELYRWK